MKKLTKLLAVFLICAFVAVPAFIDPAFAAVGAKGATSLTGGGTGALDAYDGSGLDDGDVAFVNTAGKLYVYLLDEDSADTESSPRVISPDSNAGDKRWILQRVVSNDVAAYHVDASETDHGAAGSGRSLKDIIDANGTSKSATIVLSHSGSGNTTSYVVGTDETVPDNFRLVIEEGALLSPSAGVTLTIYSPANIQAASNQQLFDGDGYPKFSKFGYIYPEWFGAIGDGTTNDYEAFKDAIWSLCTLSEGGRIVVNSLKTYLINAGANPGLDFSIYSDSGMPDGTAWVSNQTMPTFELVGTGNPATLYNTTSAGSIMFTGTTGNGILFGTTNTGTKTSFRGNVRLENLVLDGDDTADNGLELQRVQNNCIFKNITARNFTGHGIYDSASKAYSNKIDGLITLGNGGTGIYWQSNESDLLGIKTMMNQGGGLYIKNGVGCRYEGTVAHNAIPQVKIGETSVDTGLSNSTLKLYMEGQDDPPGFGLYTPTAGVGEGFFEINSGHLYSSTFELYIQNGSVATDSIYEEQYIFKVLDSTSLYANNFHYLSSLPANTGYDKYVFNDAASIIGNSNTVQGYYPGGTLSGIFEPGGDIEDSFAQTMYRDGRHKINGGSPIVGNDTGTPLFLRAVNLVIADGTNANTIKVSTTSIYNGDEIAETDNVALDATTGDFALSASGWLLDIRVGGITGQAVAAWIGSFYNNDTGTALNIGATVASGKIRLLFYSNAGAVADLTALVDSGSMPNISLFYLTDE